MEKKVEIKDKHVSLEVAELAKHFGFNEVIDTWYFVDLDSDYFIPRLEKSGCDITNRSMSNKDLDGISTKYEKYISAPTQQLLIRWLMNKHDYSIYAFPTTNYCHNIQYTSFKGVVFHKTGPTYFNFVDDDYDKVIEEAFKYVFKVMK